jgi:hypothetical protein
VRTLRGHTGPITHPGPITHTLGRSGVTSAVTPFR